LAGIFFSTSPPLIGLPMCIVAVLRRVPVAYWAMDLNPDQLIALGKLRKSDWTCRILESVNRFILGRCALIVALDRFMAARLRRRRVSPKKMLVMPPWPHEDQFTDAPDANENPFRIQHNLVGKFVFMYSGNHSPSNPLTTILQAAVRLGDDNNIRFVFVGGGSGKQQVEDYVRGHTLKNALSLPYQPLAELKNSLAAADVHIVSLGEPMVGIIHPCKIYGAMAIGRPILFLGPSPSHISDLMEQHKIGIRIDHGDVNGAVQALQKFREMPPAQLTKMAKTAQVVLTESLSQTHLTRQFCNAVEKALGLETV
jgi:glycosyltransferase involved in cell wall biosynthesis